MGVSLFITENMMVQSDVKLIGKAVETLVVEFNHQRYEEYFSSNSLFSAKILLFSIDYNDCNERRTI